MSFRNDFGTPGHALTQEQYRLAEEAGRITRPLTDGSMRPAGAFRHTAPDTPTKGVDDRRTSGRTYSDL